MNYGKGVPVQSVRNIMTRDVVTVNMDTTLADIKAAFDRHRFHHVVVVEHGRAVGVISDRDLLRHISPFVGKLAERQTDSNTLRKRAHQVMTRSMVSASEDDGVAEAACLMFKHNISCLPVLDEDGCCIGILTMNDVLRWTLDQHLDGGSAACRAA